jgi:hypothetical protein
MTISRHVPPAPSKAGPGPAATSKATTDAKRISVVLDDAGEH